MASSLAMQQPRSINNSVLWIAQVLWGIFFSFTGFGKILCFIPAVWNETLPRVPWFSAVPQWLFVFIGICEFFGGVGLILPAMTGVKPRLTPLAAISLAALMILAAGFHVMRGEYNFFLPLNLVLAGAAGFIAHGRLFVNPIAPASPNAFRLICGIAVFGALAFFGFAPVWYQVTHVR